ncbi:nitroreductase/quinone reductase family protein [Streptomyces litchfieldiae]|uniref:Nitroreductase/quinone reductase family protein n=1 Tax=Streptomyces litchfieldiae TaxID=3075543 RepID=A0ABU2MNV4_9ACTN|nr:nitroreductase/quinone reductase family protein [Streptomyces sp. DSM 44938]MDT0343141.1 nitroreductase/quinone reductase family protein [Streptomyces sp. DSM 44938]
MSTVRHGTLPDITRPGVGAVLVGEGSGADGAGAGAVVAALANGPWPAGLLAFGVLRTGDGERELTYGQWTDAEAGRAFMERFTAAEQTAYELYRSGAREHAPAPGCVVVVAVEFDGPDRERQQRWVDAVFEALDAEAEAEPHPGGISAHFHVSADGTRVLNYAEWTDEEAHRAALASPADSPAWRRVRDFPGVVAGEVTRYRPVETVETVEAEDEALDSPTDWVAAHVRRYVETDGREGHLYQGWPTLLLTTRGRKSGKRRRTALIYGRDGDRYLLVGSNAGAPSHPAWYLNLLAHAEAEVQVGAEKFTARARTATAEEKAALWGRMTEIFPLYDTYRTRTERDIPLVIVERVPAG